MPQYSLTPQQRRAVETVGRSIIVSAAAGSGKTAVLAERCAYLVSDAPPAHRCNIDDLLVLTFTDAAAAEMRSRIVEAIRERAAARPGDDRSREQAALVDTAHISTIHAFCRWLVRRHFSELGNDPAATMLDADEANLLKREVLEELVQELYAAARATETPGQPVGDHHGHQAMNPAARFLRLVDDYGLGDDRDITKLVLSLFEFTASLPDPDAWLGDAVAAAGDKIPQTVVALLEALRTEMDYQAEHCDHAAAGIEAGHSIGHPYAAQIREYVNRLREWSEDLDAALAVKPPEAPLPWAPALGPVAFAIAYEAVRQRIAEYEFGQVRAPRLPKDADPAVRAAKGAASEVRADVRERLFQERLRDRYALFSVEEWTQALKGTGPYVATIVELVRAFRTAYAARKRRLDVMDFADLERFAFALLRTEEDAERPSVIARALHRRFVHMLVDEFQDINPIQQAIIRLVSHESDGERRGNLFVVGDVKQSIYRFRLAEPAIFSERLGAFRGEANGGLALSLQSNFRSRPEIIETVNLIFRSLMRPGNTDVIYDADAELRSGRTVCESEHPQPVELHLLERTWKPDEESEGDDVEPAASDLHDPRRWSTIEREGYFIGSRIRDLLKQRRVSPGGETLAYRHIVVLLRAAKINAERIAVMLQALGIPAHAEVGGSLFGALEIRDVLSALDVLDNLQQDIPLAAVLRSGIFADPLSEDDLVEIRCHRRDVSFHVCVRDYGKHGADAMVRQRVADVLARLIRYRDLVRRRPLADVLWDIYERQGYLARAGGLPNGLQRRANLLKLHQLARRFGSFRRQGLHRFLRYIESLKKDDGDIATAPAVSESDDVVRIMSIHQSKGQEFPVVFLAALGTKFNLGDRNGRMIFERQAKIGLRALDTERMLEYPSAAHLLAASEIERATREEELRILYVAMTRARDRLIMVGSKRSLDKACGTALGASSGRPPSRLSIHTAATPLDWLLPALAAAPAGSVRGFGGSVAAHPFIEIRTHDVSEMSTWSLVPSKASENTSLLHAVVRFDPLPTNEPLDPGNLQVAAALSRINYVYPSLASASVRAAIGASEFKGAYDFTRDAGESQNLSTDDRVFTLPVPGRTDSEINHAALRGIVMHRFLQHLDFARAVDGAGVSWEMQRLVDQGVITAADSSLIDRDAVEWLVSTPLAAAIRKAGKGYRREFPYIAWESPEYFDPTIDTTYGDGVLVRGIVDGILPTADALEIVDFKTDVLRRDQAGERAERYRPQMELYSRAVTRLYARPVRSCWLVFMVPREIVQLTPRTCARTGEEGTAASPAAIQTITDG